MKTETNALALATIDNSYSGMWAELSPGIDEKELADRRSQPTTFTQSAASNYPDSSDLVTR
jgi:hypothetical protein